MFRKALFAYIPFATCLLVELAITPAARTLPSKGAALASFARRFVKPSGTAGLGSGCDRLRMLQAKLVIRASIQVDQYIFDHGVFPVIALLAEWQLLVLLPTYSLESTRGMGPHVR